jgi:hypothetical protein
MMKVEGAMCVKQGDRKHHPAPKAQLGIALAYHPTPQAWLRQGLCIRHHDERSRELLPCMSDRFLADVVHLNQAEIGQRRFASTQPHISGTTGLLYWNTQFRSQSESEDRMDYCHHPRLTVDSRELPAMQRAMGSL